MLQLAFDTIESTREYNGPSYGYRDMAIDYRETINNNQDVLPLLSRLSHSLDERWLTCVNSPSLGKSAAKAADIESDRVLSVKSSDRLDALAVIKKALLAGHSHTVIGFCDGFTDTQKEELRQYAEEAHCQCLVLSHPVG